MLDAAVECNENCWNIYWEICGILKLTCRTRIFHWTLLMTSRNYEKFQHSFKSEEIVSNFCFLFSTFSVFTQSWKIVLTLHKFVQCLKISATWKLNYFLYFCFCFYGIFSSLTLPYQAESISIDFFFRECLFFLTHSHRVKTRRLWKKCRRCEGKLSFLFSYKLFLLLENKTEWDVNY